MKKITKFINWILSFFKKKSPEPWWKLKDRIEPKRVPTKTVRCGNNMTKSKQIK